MIKKEVQIHWRHSWLLILKLESKFKNETKEELNKMQLIIKIAFYLFSISKDNTLIEKFDEYVNDNKAMIDSYNTMMDEWIDLSKKFDDKYNITVLDMINDITDIPDTIEELFN